jgi:hypothetical protein
LLNSDLTRKNLIRFGRWQQFNMAGDQSLSTFFFKNRHKTPLQDCIAPAYVFHQTKLQKFELTWIRDDDEISSTTRPLVFDARRVVIFPITRQSKQLTNNFHILDLEQSTESVLLVQKRGKVTKTSKENLTR